ncbi:conserved hypothetical protein [Burkholderiales bacterium 8X]|nr:conserved hypothetical protein [Burkholderiales bacterium 8X]
MANRQIFINLPIKNLDRSVAFFTALGFGFNAQFTNASATCMIVGEGSSYVMLLVEDFFKGFTKKQIADAAKTTEVLICLSCESREEVDALVAKAVAAGATTPNAANDHGFMYQHGFEDLDGHLWELAYMDMSAMPQA